MMTSKEMRKKIGERIIDNINNNRDLLDGIEWMGATGYWYPEEESIMKNDFDVIAYRVAPPKCEINGIVIPSPLSMEDLENYDFPDVYFPSPNKELYTTAHKSYAIENFNCNFICYYSKHMAIEASRKLFGMEDDNEN